MIFFSKHFRKAQFVLILSFLLTACTTGNYQNQESINVTRDFSVHFVIDSLYFKSLTVALSMKTALNNQEAHYFKDSVLPGYWIKLATLKDTSRARENVADRNKWAIHHLNTKSMINEMKFSEIDSNNVEAINSSCLYHGFQFHKSPNTNLLSVYYYDYEMFKQKKSSLRKSTHSLRLTNNSIHTTYINDTTHKGHDWPSFIRPVMAGDGFYQNISLLIEPNSVSLLWKSTESAFQDLDSTLDLQIDSVNSSFTYMKPTTGKQEEVKPKQVISYYMSYSVLEFDYYTNRWNKIDEGNGFYKVFHPNNNKQDILIIDQEGHRSWRFSAIAHDNPRLDESPKEIDSKKPYSGLYYFKNHRVHFEYTEQSGITIAPVDAGGYYSYRMVFK